MFYVNNPVVLICELLYTKNRSKYGPTRAYTPTRHVYTPRYVPCTICTRFGLFWGQLVIGNWYMEPVTTQVITPVMTQVTSPVMTLVMTHVTTCVTTCVITQVPTQVMIRVCQH